MRWFHRLGTLLRSPASPEEQPTEQIAPTPQAFLCAQCRRARRNPHQVRAGRARARTATRDSRGKFVPDGARATNADS